MGAENIRVNWIDRYCEENPAVKKICLALALVFVLSMVLAGCSGTDSLPYVGPIDGDGSSDGGGTPPPPDGGNGDTPTPPPPPIDGGNGSVPQPPSPPIF